MFGYIKPYRPELKIREAEDYKAVYCGLCKELGRSYGFFARMTLSYDFAFMAMLFMSLDENACPSFEKCSCIAHPFRKQCRCTKNEALSLAAKAAMILTYYKVKDDLSDKGFLNKAKALLLLPFASSARKKALSSGTEAEFIDKAAEKMIEEQKAVEERKSPLSDEAAEPTAKFLSEIMRLGGNGENEKVLERFGYLLGRYIYLCDALDDLEDDRKKGNYNPFLLTRGQIKNEELAEHSLNMMAAGAAEHFERLPLVENLEILRNILYAGVWGKFEKIKAKREKEEK